MAVTLAVAITKLFATLTAVTVPVAIGSAIDSVGAVSVPDASIEPMVVDHVTADVEPFVTVAMKVVVASEKIDADVGEMEIVTGSGLNVTVAVPVFVVSAADRAVIVSVVVA